MTPWWLEELVYSRQIWHIIFLKDVFQNLSLFVKDWFAKLSFFSYRFINQNVMVDPSVYFIFAQSISLSERQQFTCTISLHTKWSFPLRISPVNVTKSAVSCEFGHIYWRNPWWKTSFFVQWYQKGMNCGGTPWNIEISPNFLVSKIFGNAQFSLSFGWIVQNLCVSTKIHHHEIRWQLGFSCSEVIVIVHKRFKFINWRYRSSCYRIREICDFKIWSRKIRKVFS